MRARFTKQASSYIEEDLILMIEKLFTEVINPVRSRVIFLIDFYTIGLRTEGVAPCWPLENISHWLQARRLLSSTSFIDSFVQVSVLFYLLHSSLHLLPSIPSSSYSCRNINGCIFWVNVPPPDSCRLSSAEHFPSHSSFSFHFPSVLQNQNCFCY